MFGKKKNAKKGCKCETSATSDVKNCHNLKATDSNMTSGSRSTKSSSASKTKAVNNANTKSCSAKVTSKKTNNTTKSCN